MRILYSTLCLSALLATGACSKVKVNAEQMDNAELAYPMGQIEKVPPAVSPFHTSREKLTVWIDATTIGEDIEQALASLEEHKNQIGTVKPVLFYLEEMQVKPHNVGDVLDRIIAISKSATPPIRVIPTIGNVHYSRADREDLVRMLAVPALRNEAANVVERILENKNFAGIDLDLEGLENDEFPSLAKFVMELAPRVHKKGKIFSVSLEPWYISDRFVDWGRIGGVADEVTILAYPVQHKGPGPIAPLEWVQEHLKHAVLAIPNEKLIFGMPLFGFMWRLADSDDKKNPKPAPLLWTEISSYRTLVKEMEFYRNAEDIPSFKAYDSGKKVTGFYTDAASIRREMILVSGKEYGVQRFSFWRIGGEDPKIWEMLK